MAYQAGRIDRDKVNNGTPVEIGGATWFVARKGNAQALDAVEEVRKSPPGTGEDALRASAAVVVDGILRGWEGVEDANGKPIPFSREAAIEILIDDPDLAESLTLEASKKENYYRDDLKSQAKKPSPPSPTS